MTNLNDLKIGDIIIRFGQVYKVFKIENATVFYHKFLESLKQATSIFSIPQDSIEKTKIRVPIEKSKLDKLLTSDLEDLKVDLTMSLNAIKGYLNTDDPVEVMRMLKMLTLMRDENGKLPFSKREVYDTLVKRFSSEVAFVYGIDEKEAKQKIETALGRLKK
ncbi:hypothetical protein KJZ63_03560 [Patescibacteria group bacterium]|nr:hypothetical protein [Patescibacteria group bacterium]